MNTWHGSFNKGYVGPTGSKIFSVLTIIPYSFINNEEAIRPDGVKGTGLFQYLRNLESENGRSRKDVVAIIFSDVQNRMKSGYILRDVINKIHEINFSSTFSFNFLSENILS